MPRRVFHRTRLLAPHRGGFTLIELLVTVAIVVILLAVMLPALGKGISSARTFKCQLSLRGIAFDFAIFADDELHGSRGHDENLYGGRKFSLQTFIESQYGVDEFWSYGDEQIVYRPDSADQDMMRCSEVNAKVEMRRNTPCLMGAVGPTQALSFGFNYRLFRIEYLNASGNPRTKEIQLSGSILHNPLVPLVWDIDGHSAAENGELGMLSTPPDPGSIGPYLTDIYWFPGRRHAGRTNVALIDGSVAATADPLAEASWRWHFQPGPSGR